MTARTRTDTVGAPLRVLADKLAALAHECEPARLHAGVLDAALTATGAAAGRLERLGAGDDRVVLAERGDVGAKASVERHIDAGDGTTVRLAVAGVADEGEVAGLLDVAASGAQLALTAGEMSATLAGEREVTRRLVDALAALRNPGEPQEVVSTILEQALWLADGEVAVMVAGGTDAPEVAAQEGSDALTPDELAALLPLDVRREVESKHHWAGSLPADNPLSERGLRHLVVVPLGDGASLGYLAIAARERESLRERGLGALREFASHAGAAMTSSVVQREVQRLTAVDSVTRLFNGRYFAVRLDQESQRAVRLDASLSLAALTLDGLDELRAEGEEQRADQLLASLAAAVVPLLRGSDVAARIENDVLALILPDAGGFDAYTAAERIRSTAAEAPSLTGFTLSMGVASMPEQADDGAELLDRARSALVWAQRPDGDRSFLYHRDTAAEMVADERAEIEREESLIAALGALVATVDAQQPGLRGHSERVGTISRLIANELGLGSARAEKIAMAGLLHDLGKVGLPDELLAKGEPLRPDEWSEMRRHPGIAHRMLSGGSLEVVREWVLSHHERVDGGGYPEGLVGDEIPLPGRIIAVANAYDAMLSDRPYQAATSAADALAELRRCSGTQFDPAVVAALEGLVDRRVPGLPTSEIQGS